MSPIFVKHSIASHNLEFTNPVFIVDYLFDIFIIIITSIYFYSDIYFCNKEFYFTCMYTLPGIQQHR